MAIYIYTADASTNAASTPVKALAGVDRVFVGREATLTALGSSSSVFTATFNNTFTINGELFAAFDAAIESTLGGHQIQVGIDGFIGGLGGILINGSANSIVNNGTITGHTGGAIRITSGFNEIANTGTIAASGGDAIEVSGAAGTTNTVVNHGFLDNVGSGFAFQGFAADDTLINTGRLSGGADFGSGDDTFDGRDGITVGVINGGAGEDTLLGGNSNETFIGGAGGDVISGGGGFDYVSFAGGSGVTLSLTDPSLNIGDALGDQYDGIEGLIGSSANDVLVGDAFANVLNGGPGSDFLQGLGGNDTYFVDNSSDTVREAIGGGTDNVRTSASFTLDTTDAVEVLQTRNAAAITAINLTGNQFANTIIGNAGSNVINGSLGHDKLFGGGGNDFFEFRNSLSTATNLDRILDYNVAADTIRLKTGIFPGVATGTLAVAAFHIGPAPADASDRVVYNSATGALIFNSNGNAAGGVIGQFATLSPGLALTNADFVVF